MRRSEINDAIRLALDFLGAFRFPLPKWAAWGPVNWEHCGPEVAAIRRQGLGWDVTDFALGAFREQGWAGFVLRNVAEGGASGSGGYSERVLLMQRRQSSAPFQVPRRTRDLINRGGGDLMAQVGRATAAGEPEAKERVPVWVNGIAQNVLAGGFVRLEPGDALTVGAGIVLKFWAEKAACLAGEVSGAMNDLGDYRFEDPAARRFAAIEEDERPLYLLGNEYPAPD